MNPEMILNAYDTASLRYGIGAKKARLKRQRATFRARILSRMGKGMRPMQNEHDAAIVRTIRQAGVSRIRVDHGEDPQQVEVRPVRSAVSGTD